MGGGKRKRARVVQHGWTARGFRLAIWLGSTNELDESPTGDKRCADCPDQILPFTGDKKISESGGRTARKQIECEPGH